MNNKRYQIFVSSTYEDLKEERSKVIQALLKINCIPIGMENFNAADEDQFTVIKELISSCDYYVLILGGRYGSIEEHSQKSYTQLEYEYAKLQDIPTIAFFRKNVDELPVNKVETDNSKKDKLENFKKLVLGQLCMPYTTSDNLALNVITSISELISKHPRCGWVRGDSISSDEANVKILQLQKENDALKNELSAFRTQEEQNLKTLRQHDDKVSLKLISDENLNLNPFGIDLNSKPIEFEMSWDEIFTLVGGTFISPVRTNHAVDIISRIFCTFKGQSIGYFLDAACGQTILSQLYALRYLDLRTGEVFQSGVESYYVLTDYGMKEYVKLTAQKRC